MKKIQVTPNDLKALVGNGKVTMGDLEIVLQDGALIPELRIACPSCSFSWDVGEPDERVKLRALFEKADRE